MGFFEVVQVLLDHKADPNIQETGVRFVCGRACLGFERALGVLSLARSLASFSQITWPSLLFDLAIHIGSFDIIISV